MASSESVAEAKPKSATAFDSFTSFAALAPAVLLAVVPVVEGDELDRPAMHAARLVHPPEPRERAVADVLADLGVGAGERGGLPHDDLLGRRACQGKDRGRRREDCGETHRERLRF